MEGSSVGTIDLAESVFGIEPNAAVMHQMVVNYLAAQRQGTQSALTRSEVSGGGKKPWRQKGTGHARQGSTRAPQWTGGGTVFAPVPRDYSFKLNKKEKRTALKSALTNSVNNNKFIVIDELKFDAPKTKDFVKFLENIKVSDKALVVLSENDKNVILSADNLPNVETEQVGELNTYDVMKAQTLIVTKDAVARIEEVYA